MIAPRAMVRAALAVGLVLAPTLTVTVQAADAVPTVVVSGSIVDPDGQPAEVESARVEEFETPDSAAVVTAIDVDPDGTFTVALQEWGSPEQPARALFSAFGPPSEPVFLENGCWEVMTPYGTTEVDIPGAVPTDPVRIVLDRELVDGLCPPVTATPRPSGPSVTLPPTDAAANVLPGQPAASAVVLLLAAIAVLALASLLRRRELNG